MATKTTRSPAKIKMIMALCNKLGMDEATRRIFFEGVTGKTHITGHAASGMQPMTNKDLDAIINQLQRQPSLGGAAPGANPQSKKIRSLWLELKNLGELRNSSEQALLAYVAKRAAPVKSLDDLSPVSAIYIIEQLKKYIHRVEGRLIDEQAKLQGLDQQEFLNTATKNKLLNQAIAARKAGAAA